ncbi:hypothetical protein [Streptomyces albipurpureus]|uniref:Uncharacterized protein n=1 Tax=Streptomyces albipurpureus TaxID=2897419 RepID=A0ABT0UT12_9ACTN|nr:hypothetical protein [Streptomyces sp. CWNU-1]MCM2391738.1 hypothetical protein [Streptomyces sp. CWNU-1]
MTVRVRQRTVLEWMSATEAGKVYVTTTDIGATIGTEITFDHGFGPQRLIAYRPGTRHPSTAEESAGEHLRSALEQLQRDGLPPMPGHLSVALHVVIAADVHCQLWNPDEEVSTDE